MSVWALVATTQQKLIYARKQCRIGSFEMEECPSAVHTKTFDNRELLAVGVFYINILLMAVGVERPFPIAQASHGKALKAEALKILDFLRSTRHRIDFKMHSIVFPTKTKSIESDERHCTLCPNYSLRKFPF